VVTIYNVWYNEEADMLQLEFDGISFLEIYIVDISSNNIILSDSVDSSCVISSPSDPGCYGLIIVNEFFCGIGYFIKN
jgi:hypothetical protein